jgi:4a-hydroxytetrahydrobiopterin dehydratase
MSSELTARHCVPCEGGLPPLGAADAERLLADVPGWALQDDATRIERRYGFGNFLEALAFVNAVGALAETEGHHPDIGLGWGYATIAFQTHAIKGLHDNDFIMAAKVDALPRG